MIDLSPNSGTDKVRAILATDCGSTTSKARLFLKVGDEYRYIVSGEAPTTVEAPYEDVTFGIQNAIREIEALSGIRLLGKNGIITPSDGKNTGVDIYVTTSSAGGGLQMMVNGVVKEMTGESAERAALGAGAIVMDVMAVDDGRQVHEKIERIRSLRPDMILIAGGTDGGTVTHVAEIADMIVAADPKARLGTGYELPVVYAGNIAAREIVSKTLDKYALRMVDNIRPTLEIENPDPTRNAIHELFMQHVMSHAPGYNKLMKWTPVPIMPTPAGEGSMFQIIARMYNQNVLGVGLGGATTNIYSVFDGRFVRTVSANLGMSYSIGNVLKSAGIENILRWIPFEISDKELRHRLYNKIIRPTTIPDTLKDLMIEHAVAREALRLGLQHHKYLARPLRGALKADVGIYNMFDQEIKETYIDMMKLSWIGGTGGLLSHAPRRAQSALLLIDGFRPEGITRLAQDSVFMMPHLGVLSTVHPQAAMQIFEKDCLVRLGTCIAPKGVPKEEEDVAVVSFRMPDGQILTKEMPFGTLQRVPLEDGMKAKVEIKPSPRFDIGAGLGRPLKTTVEGGSVGVILDGRGRPLKIPEDGESRRRKLSEWITSLRAYPGYDNSDGGN